MSDKSNLLKQAKHDIYVALQNIIKVYNMKGASYTQLKKYYKKKTNFEDILDDIRNKAYNLFDDENEYKKTVKEILMDILDDKIAYEKDKKKLKMFEEFTTITSAISGKKITYNTKDRTILNDDNINKYVVLDKYPFDIDNVKDEDQTELILFIRNNVGKITDAKLGGGRAFYDIMYNGIPDKLQSYFTQRSYDLDTKYLISHEFDFISDNYNDCTAYIHAKKYNL